jgi:hypothetical protein
LECQSAEITDLERGLMTASDQQRHRTSVYGPLLGCKLTVSLAFEVRLLTYIRPLTAHRLIDVGP